MSKDSVIPAYLEKIRNIGIIAHIDAGKTTLTERILFYTDKIHRLGEVHDGAATMDFMPEEQEHGITISSACTTCEWNGYSVSIIDTPGHVDFTIEVERSLRVLDGAIGVFCAVAGVEPQSETVWRQSEKFGVPKLAFINKIDRPGADFQAVLHAMRVRLKANPLPLTIPLPGDGAFADTAFCVIDLITLEEVHFDQQSQGRSMQRRPVSSKHAAYAAEQRELMLERLAESDDDFFTIFLSGEAAPENIRSAVCRATLKRTLVPVFAGSALRNVGVQLLLNGVCFYLPGPANVAMPQGLDAASEKRVPIAPNPSAPLSALVFKVIMEGSRKFSLLRIYAGSLSEGDSCRNVTAQKDERFSKLYRMHAGRRDTVEKARAGELVAAVGLRTVRTGDTLADPEHPYLLENIATYRPVISLALEPKNTEEGGRLDEVLERALLEDPTLTVEQDESTGQRILSGMGELHLEVVLERIAREYGVRPRVGNPQVVHQETISRHASGSGEFDRELGEQEHYGYVSVHITPEERGAGNRILWAPEFERQLQSWSKSWTDAARQGVVDSLQSGVISGFPVEDVCVAITELKRREGASSPAGYHMAAVAAVRQALQNAAPVLLEPIMEVEITVTESFVGACIGLLGARGGKVENMADAAGQKIIQAFAPLRCLFGFSTALRSATQGRAGLLMRFERFDRMP